MTATSAAGQPPLDCALCDRLAAFRSDNQAKYPDFYNGPVRSFGDDKARLLIVGLAPGLRGANRTGRPFTGDYAGDLLYPTLVEFGFADGAYGADPGDGLALRDCRITNAVRCVPPQNKPTGPEINTCRPFLAAEMQAMPRMTAILGLGLIAHNAVLATMGEKRSKYKFVHGAQHSLAGGVTLFNSYHCSRYNVNTRRLTTEMFHDVVGAIRAFLNARD